ncbi:MAG: phosphoribosyl-ATP diphosphatase [Pseudomonadales bacterium]
MTDTLRNLASTIKARRTANPETSYVAQLNHRGLNKILSKVGEEATEVILAAKGPLDSPDQKAALVGEVADLWFHCLVLLERAEIDYNDVLQELERREGTSGIEEKRSRTPENH